MGEQRRKRPEFPSGEVGVSGVNIATWYMQRMRVQDVVFAGGDR